MISRIRYVPTIRHVPGPGFRFDDGSILITRMGMASAVIVVESAGPPPERPRSPWHRLLQALFGGGRRR